uniref:Uncharacterized protein n=1 Tax=viral metagenome TaxID=1070528 RepID=A0A6C0AX83_9ZZZZ
MPEYVLKIQDDKKKKIDPKKIPKRLYIKLKTNIERYKRVNFSQTMIYPESPNENYIYFMKYYPLQKKYFDDYQKKSRFKLFFSKSNILRITIRKDPAKDPEYVEKNIKFIVDTMFGRSEKIYLGSTPYSIYSSYWDTKIYKTNNPNIYQIDVNIVLAKGDKLSSADNFKLSCDQRRNEISDDINLIFNNLIESAKSYNNKEADNRKEITDFKEPSAPKLAVAEVVRTFSVE